MRMEHDFHASITPQKCTEKRQSQFKGQNCSLATSISNLPNSKVIVFSDSVWRLLVPVTNNVLSFIWAWNVVFPKPPMFGCLMHIYFCMTSYKPRSSLSLLFAVVVLKFAVQKQCSQKLIFCSKTIYWSCARNRATKQPNTRTVNRGLHFVWVEGCTWLDYPI